MNIEDYRGMWVAIVNLQVVDSGDDFDKIVDNNPGAHIVKVPADNKPRVSSPRILSTNELIVWVDRKKETEQDGYGRWRYINEEGLRCTVFVPLHVSNCLELEDGAYKITVEKIEHDYI